MNASATNTAGKWRYFLSHRRGFFSFLTLSVMFLLCSGAEFLSNDKPLLVVTKKSWLFPILRYYPETAFFDGEDIEMNYMSCEFNEFIQKEKAFVIWPLYQYSAQTISLDAPQPSLSPPDCQHVLGTDEQGRDVLARLLYGTRISLLFGLGLAIFSSIVGIIVGSIQGYFAGKIDLILQRIIEIWDGLPIFFLLMIVSNFLSANVWVFLGIMTLFSWTRLVPVVRAEFLRGRQQSYVKAAQALGVPEGRIIFRHILPNALAPALSCLPFLISSGISALTALDFLGIGLSLGTPSLGDLLRQGKSHLYAPWLGLSAFLTLGTILVLVTFIGEALRDTFSPHKPS